MKSKIVFGLLVLLYACSFFLRGEDPAAQMGDRVMEGVFFQGGYGMEWVWAAAAEFERAHPDITAYSYWDYQAGAWQKDNGVRIDHLLLSPQAADRLGPDPAAFSFGQPARCLLGYPQY